MSSTADELFGGGGAPEERDRLKGLGRLLVVSALVDFLCPLVLLWELARFAVTGEPDVVAFLLLLTVPAALTTLWVWYRADEEMHRGETLDDLELRVRARRLRLLAFLLLVFCALSMIGQTSVLGMVLSQVEPVEDR